MINNLNEIIIFFLIIIIIILSYYDIKYSIIFIIISYLFYIYFNKITFKEEVNYKKYDDNINITLTKLEKYKNIDYDSYRLGLKYYKYFIRNIKIINDTYNDDILKSYLENSKIYLETSIFHFKSILFSINIDNMNYINDINSIIKDLEKYGNILIAKTEHQYNKIIKCDDIKQEKYNIFCDNDPLINKFKHIKPELYEKPIYDKGIFDDNNITILHNMINNDTDKDGSPYREGVSDNMRHYLNKFNEGGIHSLLKDLAKPPSYQELFNKGGIDNLLKGFRSGSTHT